MTRAMADGMDRFWRMRSWLDIAGAAARAPRQGAAVHPRLGRAAAPRCSGARGVPRLQPDGARCATPAVAACQRVRLRAVAGEPGAGLRGRVGEPDRTTRRGRSSTSRFTLPYNMSEQPAASVNCGYTASGLPIGLQIVGHRHDDLGVLQAGARLGAAAAAAAALADGLSRSAASDASCRCSDARGNPVGTASPAARGARRDGAVAHDVVLRHAAGRPRRRDRRTTRLAAAARDEGRLPAQPDRAVAAAPTRAPRSTRAERCCRRRAERERAHLAAAQRCARRPLARRLRAWDELLLEHPRDALALQWAHLFDFYRGDARSLRLRPARVLPEWDDDDPLHPYVLGAVRLRPGGVQPPCAGRGGRARRALAPSRACRGRCTRWRT